MSISSRLAFSPSRSFAAEAYQKGSVLSARQHRIVVIGAGSAGCSIAHQLLRSNRFRKDEIAVIDPSRTHHYQPGWTLVGAGLKDKDSLQRPLREILSKQINFVNDRVTNFVPDENSIKLANGRSILYDQLVVAPGIEIKLDQVSGLRERLEDKDHPVSSIYSFKYCDKVYDKIKSFQGGKAIFTQPKGVLKCAGAPQKIMWLAYDHWKKSFDGFENLDLRFYTGLDKMFGVARYNETLDRLRKERQIAGLFQHNLIRVTDKEAEFEALDTGEKSNAEYDFLHVVPPMGPYEFVASSVLANAQGFVEVNKDTLQHERYANIWSAGDASSLPTSKTAAAITSQAPVLVRNLLDAMDEKPLRAQYDGYTSCPIPTEFGKLLLAEFAYDGVPKETFSSVFDQREPRRLFYHMKKDFFPWVYFNFMVCGLWQGPKGFLLGNE